MACRKPRTPFLGLPLSLLLLGALTLAASALKAVNMVDFCDQMLQGDGMIVRSHPESQKFYFVAVETDCWLTVKAVSPQDRVLFQFRFFLVYSLTQPPPSELPQTTTSGLSQLTEDPCTTGSYLQFYDGPAKEGPRLGNPLCGLTIPGPVLSTGRSLSLRLVTRGQQPRVDFIGDFTSFRPGSSISPCGLGSYFLCRNKRCIPQSLVCDTWGIDNCGDGSDQTSQPPASCRAVTMANPMSPVFLMTQGSLNPSSSRVSGDNEPKSRAKVAKGSAGILGAAGLCRGCDEPTLVVLLLLSGLDPYQDQGIQTAPQLQFQLPNLLPLGSAWLPLLRPGHSSRDGS
ncbi:low-density lipoprotein receptor class A domain-containing protein 2 [Petaurus breviceps papuanus]|uniref:low-density lipoprotein receptor class A domain-containing protein 2 n=1 Tax=Petaurus breviceps papuanus TaxID=3040969 RepID=UPI0036DDD0A8